MARRVGPVPNTRGTAAARKIVPGQSLGTGGVVRRAPLMREARHILWITLNSKLWVSPNGTSRVPDEGRGGALLIELSLSTSPAESLVKPAKVRIGKGLGEPRIQHGRFRVIRQVQLVAACLGGG